jgi:hypothetical protein
MSGPYFENVKGGFSIYTDASADGSAPNVRFCLAYFGEDAEKVLEAFHKEHRTDCLMVPIFGYGSMGPRIELSSPRSLAAALATATIEPDGVVGQQWRAACEYHGVAWPKRLSRPNRSETGPKAPAAV